MEEICKHKLAVGLCDECGGSVGIEPMSAGDGKQQEARTFKSQGEKAPGWCANCGKHRSLHREWPNSKQSDPEWCNDPNARQPELDSTGRHLDFCGCKQCNNYPAPQVEGQGEFGWLIERVGQQWLCISEARHFHWSSDSLKAIRFARKEDAEAILRLHPELYEHQGLCVTEHRWG